MGSRLAGQSGEQELGQSWANLLGYRRRPVRLSRTVNMTSLICRAITISAAVLVVLVWALAGAGHGDASLRPAATKSLDPLRPWKCVSVSGEAWGTEAGGTDRATLRGGAPLAPGRLMLTSAGAGVDLSHLGRRFGQELNLSESFLKQAEAEDRRMIDRILARDTEGFFRLIQEERDRRNVCGVPAIYTLLRLLGDSAPGRLLDYAQAVEEPTQSVVTFMGAAFYA